VIREVAIFKIWGWRGGCIDILAMTGDKDFYLASIQVIPDYSKGSFERKLQSAMKAVA